MRTLCYYGGAKEGFLGEGNYGRVHLFFFFLEPSLKDAVQACCQSHPDARDFHEQARHPSTLHLDLASQTCPPLYPGQTGTPQQQQSQH